MDGLQLPPGVHLCASYIGRPGIAGRFAQANTIAGEIG
jgi:oxygen-dependent protoporphyrinogen oxidase